MYGTIEIVRTLQFFINFISEGMKCPDLVKPAVLDR